MVHLITKVERDYFYFFKLHSTVGTISTHINILIHAYTNELRRQQGPYCRDIPLCIQVIEDDLTSYNIIKERMSQELQGGRRLGHKNLNTF